jgi:serine/threonine protein kinase
LGGERAGPGASPSASEETVAYVGGRSGRSADESWPDRVSGYRLVRKLGQGGMGRVFEAEEEATGRRVAVKLIAPEAITSREAMERFRQEGRLASSVSHPRCVFVIRADEADGRPYIVMELMPGTTLQDLVERDGPLPIESAVPKILDVIDGLIEAHKLGVIHRDVKPSNCFVDEQGRIKIGDFGLSKSVGAASNLTRTGSFLGTPLYASSEQIKGEPLDVRTDVYSVGATLYFLLTGRPPYEGSDAAATLARIVSEPLVPLRSLREEVPPDLERVIERAMDRRRDRRPRDLEELRAALIPFAPGRLPAARLSRRLAAFLIDVYACKFLLIASLNLVLVLASRGRLGWSVDTNLRISVILDILIHLFSFGLLEAFTGASPGKWLMGLRLWGTGLSAPRFQAVWLRTLIFFAASALPWDLWALFLAGHTEFFRYNGVAGVLRVVLPLILFATARRSNGYRGWHEIISGTRVVELPRLRRRVIPERRRPIPRDRARASGTSPVGVLRNFGSFRTRGAVRWEPNRKVLAAEDASLGREAWIVLRPRSGPPPSTARQRLARSTRPRWLAGGEQAETRWDAYVAPTGSPLGDLVGSEGLPWADVRPILEDLTEELVTACADGTMPHGVTVDQVWVQPDGAAILVDALETTEEEGDGTTSARDRDGVQARALALLRQTAALALEGGRFRSTDTSQPIRAAVPLHARAILDRLGPGPNPFQSVAEVQEALTQTRDEITEVDRTLRALHLGVQTVLLFPGLVAVFSFGYFLLARLYTLSDQGPGGITTEEVVEIASEGPTILLTMVALVFGIWIVWAALTRGGLSFRLVGLGLVGPDGRPAGRLRSLWRALLVWGPPAAPLMGAARVLETVPGEDWLAWLLFALAGLVLLTYVPIALMWPDRGPHDRLAGTRITPR